jgi:hypothetical protein
MHPQSNLKGQHCFSWLLPPRKKTQVSAQQEQLNLLRQILAELHALNANLAKRGVPAEQSGIQANDDDSDDEELEEYE